MTRLVFLILGELSAGELTIADSFQAGLPKEKYESYFIVPNHQKNYLESRNIPYLSLGLSDGKVINRKKVELFIKEIHPDLLIFCDVFTVEYSEKWSGVNLKSIKELNIENIEIKEDIRIIGSFTKGIVIKFECRFKLNSMENGLINGEVTGFKILNIGIASFLRKIALKFALKSLSDMGISYDKGKVIIQYKYLLKDIPYVDFDIYSIYCAYGVLNVELKNINLSLGGELKKEIELISFEKENKTEFNEEEIKKIIYVVYNILSTYVWRICVVYA